MIVSLTEDSDLNNIKKEKREEIETLISENN